MGLFEHLNVTHPPLVEEHEEAGRFIPLTQVKTGADLAAVIGNVSALLHLDREPHALAAVQYCISELIRNVLEHSGSIEGAYVCAQRYTSAPPRVSIAVADCGFGIASSLSNSYPEAEHDDKIALQLSMQLGITGAVKSGMYGSATENAGAGLFFTRAIAKATGGYFALISGNGAFRIRRLRKGENPTVYLDAFNDRRHNFWTLGWRWPGTVAAAEVLTQNVPSFPKFFQSIVHQLPAKKTAAGKIKFT